jgi:hypothetical protein
MRLAMAFVLLGGIVGCGRAAAEPALYTGRVGTDARDATRVTTEPSVPAGYVILGDVASRCRADDGVVALDDESLADVDCSDELLLAALREKAASVGGAALVGLRCVVMPESRGDLLDSEIHSCSAAVAAPVTNARGPAGPSPGKRTEFVPPYTSPNEAFRVSVTLVPAEKNPVRRRAIPSESVAELAVVPPGRVVVGDIVARGAGDCDRAVVRHAVRAAAGRAGATLVAGVSCVHDDAGWLCTGRAARPEIDEVATR